MPAAVTSEVFVRYPEPHPKQAEFVDCRAKRRVVRAGRRGGKTTGLAIVALDAFAENRRVLYAVPTTDQLLRFWSEVTRACADAVAAGMIRQNITEHLLEKSGTDARIRAKTAWNASTIRGDYCDVLILDEWQLMDETAWEEVGAPMLLDTNGDAIFVYTPPSLRSRSTSKARDPQHAAKLYRRAASDQTGRWKVFTFRSHDNPHISREALDEISRDMTAVAYRQEIMAEDVEQAPGALWTREVLESGRVLKAPEMSTIVIGLDPSASSTGDEAGIVAAGRALDHAYVLEDASLQGSPMEWAAATVALYHKVRANRVAAESNQGGEMIRTTIHQIDPNVPVVLIHAHDGKRVRADPVSARYQRGCGHHVGAFTKLEDELCLWSPDERESPNRLDAMVHAVTELFNPTAGAVIGAGSSVRR